MPASLNAYFTPLQTQIDSLQRQIDDLKVSIDLLTAVTSTIQPHKGGIDSGQPRNDAMRGGYGGKRGARRDR